MSDKISRFPEPFPRFLGLTETKVDRYPVVKFEYPDSGTNKMRQRYIKVVEANADYIRGYELDDPDSKKEGMFKTFSKTRIVKNGISLVSF